jgi:hypothetical protein
LTIAKPYVSRPQAQTETAAIPLPRHQLVTCTEEWWVEAETAEEARALFACGQGHHHALGERVHVELEELLEE